MVRCCKGRAVVVPSDQPAVLSSPLDRPALASAHGRWCCCSCAEVRGLELAVADRVTNLNLASRARPMWSLQPVCVSLGLVHDASVFRRVKELTFPIESMTDDPLAHACSAILPPHATRSLVRHAPRAPRARLACRGVEPSRGQLIRRSHAAPAQIAEARAEATPRAPGGAESDGAASI